MQLSAICFTLNNYTEADTKVFADELPAIYSYAVVGKEVGESGTPHLQGYVKMRKRTAAKKAFNDLAALFESRPHMEVAKGSAKKNRVYCSKDGDFAEFGEITNQGKRMDLEALKDAVLDGASWEQLALEHTAAHARFHKWSTKLAGEIRKRENREALRKSMSAADLRPWQERAIKALQAQGDREVLWIWEATGGTGKTFLAKWLCVMEDAFYCEGGKKADISYAYDLQETVVFDLSRQTQEFTNYGVIESFKNGLMFSAKYESATKFFKPARVVVFSNWAPDRSMLSEDRWNVIELETSSRASASASSGHITNEFIFIDEA